MIGLKPRQALCGGVKQGGRYLGVIELVNPGGDETVPRERGERARLHLRAVRGVSDQPADRPGRRGRAQQRLSRPAIGDGPTPMADRTKSERLLTFLLLPAIVIAVAVLVGRDVPLELPAREAARAVGRRSDAAARQREGRSPRQAHHRAGQRRRARWSTSDERERLRRRVARSRRRSRRRPCARCSSSTWGRRTATWWPSRRVAPGPRPTASAGCLIHVHAAGNEARWAADEELRHLHKSLPRAELPAQPLAAPSTRTRRTWSSSGTTCRASCTSCFPSSTATISRAA